jgi:phosphoribosyl-ATP pyrophosphohydrolase/phosphoribosyl-AMP cyclohydrolase
MKPDFSKHENGQLPVIIQDDTTHRVLLLGFIDEEAFSTVKEKSKVDLSKLDKSGKRKDELSELEVKEILLDCDSDTLLIKAETPGPVCHTGADTCFNETNHRFVLRTLEQVIANHKQNSDSTSYVSSLFDKGIDHIADRLGEEAAELVFESTGNNDQRFLNEAADLLYHYLILLHAKNYSLHNVVQILGERHS